MLDAHPPLAVPDESHFVIGLAPPWWRPRRQATLDDMLAHPKLPPGTSIRSRCGPRSAADARVRSYAALLGRVLALAIRVGSLGDKTPGYVSYLPTLARMFPDARFVHIVRDGREVAASLAEWDCGARTAVSSAFWWDHKVRVGRRTASASSPTATTSCGWRS